MDSSLMYILLSMRRCPLVHLQIGGIILPSDSLTLGSLQHFLYFESFIKLDQNSRVEMLGGHKVRVNILFDV